MDKFVRGAKVRQPAKSANPTIKTEDALSLGECIYVMLDVRHRKHKNITKEQLLHLVSAGYDAYERATSTECDVETVMAITGLNIAAEIEERGL